METFTKVSADAFDALQLNAGVILDSFDIENPYEIPASAHIVATTTGGVKPSCKATYEDYGADVDNVPNNMKEFKQLTGWDCKLAFTSIKFNADNTQLSLGAADKEVLQNGVTKVVPRRDVKLADFHDIWWVGDKADGGAYAIKLKDALSTEGIDIQTKKNGKGTMAVTLTGHVSIATQSVMPMEFYDIPPQSV